MDLYYNIIEAWGCGIEKMCNECVAEGIAKPEYTVHQYDLMLKFSAKAMVDSTISSTINSTVSSTIKLNETESKIIEIMKEDESITLSTMARALGKDLSTIKKAIKKLKEKGLIERIGSNKLGLWKVK